MNKRFATQGLGMTALVIDVFIKPIRMRVLLGYEHLVSAVRQTVWLLQSTLPCGLLLRPLQFSSEMKCDSIS